MTREGDAAYSSDERERDFVVVDATLRKAFYGPGAPGLLVREYVRSQAALLRLAGRNPRRDTSNQEVTMAAVEARDALAEAMFKARYSAPGSDDVERAWTKVKDASGYEASMVLGILHGAGFDVVRRDA